MSERIIREASDIDVTLVSTGVRDERQATRPLDAWRDGVHSPPRAYLYALLIGAALTVVASWLNARNIAVTNLVMLYLLGVVFAAVRLGRGPGMMLSFLSVAAFDFFFVPPQLSFSVTDTQYLLTLVVMLLTSLTISHLTSSLRREARIAARTPHQRHVCVTRELAAALMTEQIIEIGTRHVAEVFSAKVAMLRPDALEKVRQKVGEPNPDLTLDTAREAELAVPEQRRMIETFAAQIALALERVHYVEIAQDALVNMESERLRNSLLAAVSHDLRTPLTSIVGFASVLEEQARGDASHELVHAIHEEALRMSGLVTPICSTWRACRRARSA